MAELSPEPPENEESAPPLCPLCSFHELRPGKCPECGRDVLPRRADYRFSLGTLMLFVTLSAVAMGAFLVSPWLGATIVVVSVMAIFNCNSWIVVRHCELERFMSYSERVRTYLTSWLFMFGAFSVGVGIFFAIGVCEGIVIVAWFGMDGFSGRFDFLLMASGAMAGLLAGAATLRAIWPRMPDHDAVSTRASADRLH
jgi:hypothetical protein